MQKLISVMLGSAIFLVSASALAFEIEVSKEACAHWISDDLAKCLATDSSKSGGRCLNTARRDYPRCLHQVQKWHKAHDEEAQIRSAAEVQVEAAKAPHIVGNRFRDRPDTPTMVGVPPGKYLMGTDKSSVGSPPHLVTITYTFSISSGEVTEREWLTCVLDKACDAASLNVNVNDLKKTPAEDDKAIAGVTWDEAQQYVQWLSRKTGQNYRLPTEAEWEYAARGGTSTRYFWGDSYQLGAANCENLMKPGRDTFDLVMPDRVKVHPANAFGLFDTVGNVAEWVQDCQGSAEAGEYTNPPIDGSAYPSCESGKRVARGGSAWNPADCTSDYREFHQPDEVSPVVGFRVVRDNVQPSVLGRTVSKDRPSNAKVQESR